MILQWQHGKKYLYSIHVLFYVVDEHLRFPRTELPEITTDNSKNHITCRIIMQYLEQ